MMYPFMTLNDDTEITHSEVKGDGTVKVYIETPDDDGGFKSATCYLPKYQWVDVQGYSEEEMRYFHELVASTAHLMMEFAAEGGFANASGF